MPNASERLRNAKAYARERLAREVAEKPRGHQARLVRELKITSPHIANMVSGKSLPGEEVMAKLAEYWGMTLDQLIATANNETVPERAAVTLSVVSDRVHPVIARVASRSSVQPPYDDEEIAAASTSIFGLHGTADMTEEQAAEILDETRRQRRNLSRVLAPKIAPRVLDEDDFDIRAPQLPAINPRRKR